MTSSAPATGGTSTSATPTRTSCSLRSTPPGSAPARCSRSTTRTAFGIQTARSSASTIPCRNIQALNEAGGALPVNRHVASPRLKQPYTDQISVGWSHQLDSATVLDVDYMHVEGRDIGWRPRLNARHPGAAGPAARAAGDQSEPGRHRHRDQRRREPTRRAEPWPPPPDESRACSSRRGTRSRDRSARPATAATSWTCINIQNSADPFNDVQNGPSRRSDSRHRATISAIFSLPAGFQVSPIWRYRSGLPVNIVEGVDLNHDGVNQDIPARAYAFDGVGNAPKDIGECKTINCGRGASLSQVNLRVVEGLRTSGRHAARSYRRGLQPVQREEPVRLRSGDAVPRSVAAHRSRRGGDGESELPAADDLCWRLPGAGAARRADRV